jgi:3-hydroxyisobutyrate dehydrogenase
MTSVGFIDIGMMGSRMVNCLLDAGHSATGYNRTRSKVAWLTEDGMRWADTPRKATTAKDIVFNNVARNHSMEAVNCGPHGFLSGLAIGKIHIDMRTLSPTITKRQGKLKKARRCRMEKA